MYTGTVKSFNPDKGWGHIECEETFAHFGKDIFLLRSQLLGGVDKVQKGQPVTFGIADNGRGPEATDVLAVGGGGGGCGGPAATSSTAVVEEGDLQGAYIGVVKSFNPNSGWGHISCQETEQLYGKDMFFMKSQLPTGSISKGASVQFHVAQGTKGPEARSIVELGATAGPKPKSPQAQRPPFVPSKPIAAPTSIQPGGCGGQALLGAVGGCGGCGNPNTVYYGKIKQFKEDKGWGHISCPQTHEIYGKDMFLLRSALNGTVVKEGDYIQFGVTLGLKGPEAANVRVLGHMDEHQIYMGSIKMYNEEKGWGFIECNETRLLYNKDVFIHKKDLSGHAPSVGETVQFTVTISESGRPEGSSLSFGGAAYVAWRGDPTGGLQEQAAFGDGHGPIQPTRAGRPGPYV